MLFAFTGLRISRLSADPFVRLVAGGATVWICGQAVINVGYVTGLLPVTGIPLPFISAGGTSLLATSMVFGMLVSFARHEPAAVKAAQRAAADGRRAGSNGGAASRCRRPTSPPSGLPVSAHRRPRPSAVGPARPARGPALGAAGRRTAARPARRAPAAAGTRPRAGAPAQPARSAQPAGPTTRPAPPVRAARRPAPRRRPGARG